MTRDLFPGVSLSHAAILDIQTRLEQIHSDDVLLNFSQLFWISGLMVLLWGTLHGATRLITTQKFSPELEFHLIEKYKATIVMNAVYQMVSLVKSDLINETDLSSVKHYLVAGNKVPYDISAKLNEYLSNGNVHNVIGMTETSGIYAGVFPEFSDKDTVGKLLSSVKAKIVDDDGNACGINSNGELCLKFNYKLIGYYGSPDATEQVFDEDGFFVTGDIAYFDENGYLFIVDRKKEMLKYYNFQVTPSEIEGFLLNSTEIEAACVVGVPDITACDLPAAAIIRKKHSKITEQDIFLMVESNIYI